MTCWSCLPRMTSRCGSPITISRPRHGRRRRVTFTFAAMVLRGVSGTTSRKTPCAIGHAISAGGGAREGLYLSISTTTRRAPRPKTRGG
jgi:hypothetical protein